MNVILQREEKEEEEKLSSNKKVWYQLWTDGNGSFGVKKDDDEFMFVDGIFIVKLNKVQNNNNENNRIKLLYEKWLKQKCTQVFESKLNQFSKKLGATPNNYTIKNLKNRWGSLTKKGTIVLNINLIKAPERIIDYIIIHELCHLIIEGHSHKFWSLLHKYIPDYQDKIEWLNTNSEKLL